MPRKSAAETSDDPFEGLSFEQAFAQLEEVVTQLEAGDLPLERSLELHARGQKLAEYCAKRLDEAELRVRQIGDSEWAPS
jgi:exodeoxyribonuclease VII small subunit